MNEHLEDILRNKHTIKALAELCNKLVNADESDFLKVDIQANSFANISVHLAKVQAKREFTNKLIRVLEDYRLKLYKK